MALSEAEGEDVRTLYAWFFPLFLVPRILACLLRRLKKEFLTRIFEEVRNIYACQG